MESEVTRRTVGYTPGTGLRLEFRSEDGEWTGTAEYGTSGGDEPDHVLIDLSPVE